MVLSPEVWLLWYFSNSSGLHLNCYVHAIKELLTSHFLSFQLLLPNDVVSWVLGACFYLKVITSKTPWACFQGLVFPSPKVFSVSDCSQSLSRLVSPLLCFLEQTFHINGSFINCRRYLLPSVWSIWDIRKEKRNELSGRKKVLVQKRSPLFYFTFLPQKQFWRTM